MGNSLEAYSAAIGAFHLTTRRLISLSMPKINICFRIYCALSIWCRLGLKCFVKNDKFSVYKLLLLLMCMAVYPNRGPLSNETSVNSLYLLHLNTRSIRNKL